MSTRPNMTTPNAVDYFLASVDRFADRPALWVDGRSWTYAELHDEVRHLQQRLERHAGSVCATVADRSLTAYCAPLACMLAGRIHVPLGTSFPPERMTNILSRTRPSVLICDSGGASMLQELTSRLDFPITVLHPSEVRADADSTPADERIATTRPEPGTRSSGLDVDDREIAYVLFTSGSTGQPKGVAVGHRALCAYVDAVRTLYPELDERQRCSQFFEPTFDLSMHDMFVTWAVGACLYSVPRQALMMPTDFVNEHRLSVWFSVPSLAAALQRFGQLASDAFPFLRLALFCGEALPGPLAGAWLAAAPNARCENIYGPTEATIACTAHRFDAADVERSVVPIGRAFPGMEIAVVDAQGLLCAEGRSGELWLGGRQLAFGYWLDQAQTTARFVERTLPGHTSERWYRSGDLAMIETGGNALFLGRADRQIKLRGYRIELQEVEAHLREACSTAGTSAEVAVIAILPPGADAPTGLAAFVVSHRYDARKVMAAIKARLPAYMVPSEVHPLDALPLNSNGKVDYRALAARRPTPSNPRTRRAASHGREAVQ